MKTAYEAGINFFDTAEQYTGGQSEVVLGQAIKKFGWKQNDLVISTKVGHFLKYSLTNSANPPIALLGRCQQRQPQEPAQQHRAVTQACYRGYESVAAAT